MSAPIPSDDDLDCIEAGVLPLTLAADLWRQGHYLPTQPEIPNDDEEA